MVGIGAVMGVRGARRSGRGGVGKGSGKETLWMVD
jgi:hypothetical protein